MASVKQHYCLLWGPAPELSPSGVVRGARGAAPEPHTDHVQRTAVLIIGQPAGLRGSQQAGEGAPTGGQAHGREVLYGGGGRETCPAGGGGGSGC